jgi:nitrogen fixation/metabolism regulation signal transduction histidine kinase
MKDAVYADNEIIRLRNLQRKLLLSFDLEVDSVLISSKKVSFAYRELFEGQACMLLPAHFIPMPDELARLRYLSAHRPQVILTDREDPFENICVNCIARNERDLLESATIMRDSALQSAPETVFYDAGQIAGKNCEGYWFEYKSFTINDEAYNLQFLFGSRQIILLGVFNCCISDFDEWKPFILKALEYTEITERSSL